MSFILGNGILDKIDIRGLKDEFDDLINSEDVGILLEAIEAARILLDREIFNESELDIDGAIKRLNDFMDIRKFIRLTDQFNV